MFCQFCGANATAGIQVDPSDPRDVRPACGRCAEKIKALAGSYKIVPLDKARAVVVEGEDEEGGE